MAARRFFVEGAQSAGATVALDDRDAHKIVRVLRLRDGDEIEIVDTDGRAFAARVRLAGGGVVAELETQRERAPVQALRVDVAQGIPKGAKMDFAIEKATEFGASAIVPFYSERCAVRDLGDAKLERWRRLAKTAAAQCDRRVVPEVAAPLTFDELLARFSDYDAVLMPWEQAKRQPLREVLPATTEAASRILVAIGPEGGFSGDEAARAGAAGAHLVWLGERILRSETAALAVLAAIGYLRDL